MPDRLKRHLTTNHASNGAQMEWQAVCGAVCGQDNPRARHKHPDEGRGLSLAGAMDGGGRSGQVVAGKRGGREGVHVRRAVST